MDWREQPSVLRRGAAPANERTVAVAIALACVVHLVLVPVALYKTRPVREIALPASSGAHATRTRLVRLSPLRSFPAPEAAQAPAKARPKPALLKRYTSGAKIAIREERTPAKKGKGDETKVSPKTVAAAPAADLVPRWFSADSSRVTSARTEGDFRFAFYLSTLRNKIGSRWVPPQGVDARNRPVKTVVYFRVKRSGQIDQARVEASSGYAFFDQTAMRALLAATPLPPLPAAFPDSYLGVHFEFEYQQ